MSVTGGHRNVTFAHGTKTTSAEGLSKQQHLNTYYYSSDDEEDEDDRRLREQHDDDEEEEQERLLSERHGEVEEAPTRKKRKEKSDKEIEAEYAAASRKKRMRFTFQPNQLIGSKGLVRIKNEFANSLQFPKNTKRSKQDSAAAYSRNLVNAYKSFCYDLFPGLALEDMLLKIEAFGSKKEVKSYLHTMRDDVRKSHLESIFGEEKTERLLRELEYGLKQQQESFLGDYQQEEENIQTAVSTARNPYQTRTSVPHIVAQDDETNSPTIAQVEEDELETSNATPTKDDASNEKKSTQEENTEMDKEHISTSSSGTTTDDDGVNTTNVKDKEIDATMASSSDLKESDVEEDSVQKNNKKDNPEISKDMARISKDDDLTPQADPVSSDLGEEDSTENDKTNISSVVEKEHGDHDREESPQTEKTGTSSQNDETLTIIPTLSPCIETETQATQVSVNTPTMEVSK